MGGWIVQGSLRAAMAAFVLLSLAAASPAAELTPEQKAERTKVHTAVDLARIAEETKDGDALLVAARLLASVSPVAMSAAKAGERPPMFDVQKMAARAKELGGDPVKADQLATQPTSKVSGSSPATGFWQADYCPSGYDCTYTWVY